MRVIENLTEGYAVYDALASYTRLDILNVLLKNNEMNLDDISKALNITKGSLTMHIKKLEEAGAAVKVDTPREAIEALCRLALDAGERKKMSKAGRLWHDQNEGATDRTLAAISNLQ